MVLSRDALWFLFLILGLEQQQPEHALGQSARTIGFCGSAASQLRLLRGGDTRAATRVAVVGNLKRGNTVSWPVCDAGYHARLLNGPLTLTRAGEESCMEAAQQGQHDSQPHGHEGSTASASGRQLLDEPGTQRRQQGQQQGLRQADATDAAGQSTYQVPQLRPLSPSQQGSTQHPAISRPPLSQLRPPGLALPTPSQQHSASQHPINNASHAPAASPTPPVGASPASGCSTGISSGPAAGTSGQSCSACHDVEDLRYECNQLRLALHCTAQYRYGLCRWLAGAIAFRNSGLASFVCQRTAAAVTCPGH